MAYKRFFKQTFKHVLTKVNYIERKKRKVFFFYLNYFAKF